MPHVKHPAYLAGLVLLMLAAARILLVQTHDPLFAYANNYDQVRTMSALGLSPADERYRFGEGTHAHPLRYFDIDREEKWIYLSSAIALDYLLLRGRDRLSDNPAEPRRVDIRVKGAFFAALWILILLIYHFRLARSRQGVALLYALVGLLIADPFYSLYLNTLYMEPATFIGLLWFASSVLLAIIEQRIPRRRIAAWGLLLLAIALSRNQYQYLFLALIPMLAGVAPPWRKRFGLALVIGLVATIGTQRIFYLTNPDATNTLNDIKNTNTINTFFGAVLPALSDPARTLDTFGLEPECIRFSGDNWYIGDLQAIFEQCPAILSLSLADMGLMSVQDPAAIATMIRNAALYSQELYHRALGQVAHESKIFILEAGGVPYLGIADIIANMDSRRWLGLVFFTLFSPWLAALLAWTRGATEQAAWPTFLGAMLGYSFFSSLYGDGYIDFPRHAFLFYGLALAWFATFAYGLLTTLSPREQLRRR